MGHGRWLGPGAPLRRAVEEGTLRSLVLWGPPGCGKTTLARLLAAKQGSLFLQLSAVLDGVKELRGVLDRAETTRRFEQRRTILFVDEIHRWNKAQQDALLPHVESGLILLIGATTENPSFELNAALRSRVQLIRLDAPSENDVLRVLSRALTHPDGIGPRPGSVSEEALAAIARAAAGDVRQALSDLERVVLGSPPGSHIGASDLPALLRDRGVRHDRDGEDHHNVYSALIKSMRGSDPDAAVYWLARLVHAGEPPAGIARRLVIFAAEDVGNADPRALQVAAAAQVGVERTGYPEARILLSQAVLWLACAPKSNAAYLAINRAIAEVERSGALPVPLHLRNAPSAHLREEGYGAGYQYPHDHPDQIVAQQYLPDALSGTQLYDPKPVAEEKTIRERLAWWKRRLEQR